jgi:TPR repeat protein
MTMALKQGWIPYIFTFLPHTLPPVHTSQMEEDMALRGNLDAQRNVAYRRLLGRGIEADPEGAYRHFEAAAQHGDGYSIFNLGWMHLKVILILNSNGAFFCGEEEGGRGRH